MMGKTHAASGAAIGAALGMAMNLPFEQLILCSIMGCIGGLLPDIDQENSMIAKKTGAVGSAISRIFTHRGILHTPIFYFLDNFMFLVCVHTCFPKALEIARICVIGLLGGEISHLALDSLNHAGIMWLFPLRRKHFHVLNAKTDGIVDSVIRTVCTIYCAAVFFFLLFASIGS